MDRICAEDFGLPTIVLMENAARALFDCVADVLGGRTPARVLVVCGGGNNGGDGYAVARHLGNAGHDVTILAAKPADEFDGDAAVNARVAEKMSLPILPATADRIAASDADVIVDALLGSGLTSPPRPDAAALIRAMNAHPARVVSADVPSGLDGDVGRPLGDDEDCVRADATVAFVAERVGFEEAQAWLGRVVVGDIGCPREAIDRATA